MAAPYEMEKETRYSWETLKKVSDELGDNIPIESNSENSCGISIDLLKLRCQKIEAEIETVNESTVSHYPESRYKQFEIITNELETNLNSLNETLSFVKEQKREIDTMVQTEENVFAELQCVSEMLQSKISEHEQKLQNLEGYPDRKRLEIQEKIKHGNSYFKKILRELQKFVDQQLPLPSEETFNEVKKKLRSADRKMTHKDMSSLKDMLSSLMNSCIDTPDDPYIIIDYTFWPPYVELLLRCQIVLRHPDDANRLRLVPFHL